MKAEAILNAWAEDVSIADYHHGHPHILPPYDLQVEQGLTARGSIICFKSCFLGVEKPYYQRVTEPEPDHVLVEQDIDTIINSTTFTVTLWNRERVVHHQRTCNLIEPFSKSLRASATTTHRSCQRNVKKTIVLSRNIVLSLFPVVHSQRD